MNYQKQYKRFKRTANVWLDALDNYSEEQLRTKPSENEWSMGQVYHHVIFAHNNLIGKSLKTCIEGRGKETQEKKNFAGSVVFFINGLPPLKYKMPPKVAVEALQPESREWIKEELKSMTKSMKEIYGILENSTITHKAKHPIFGYLTVDEWFQFCEIHLRHHLLQKRRIDKFLGK